MEDGTKGLVEFLTRVSHEAMKARRRAVELEALLARDEAAFAIEVEKDHRAEFMARLRAGLVPTVPAPAPEFVGTLDWSML